MSRTVSRRRFIIADTRRSFLRRSALVAGTALALGSVVATLLYEVRSRDPFVLTVVVGIVAAAGFLSAAAATLT